MSKENMEVISISPGQVVSVEQFRLADGGLEFNAQLEYEHRFENLVTARVVNIPISTDGSVSGQPDWNMVGWIGNEADSLLCHINAGVNLWCKPGVGYIGGRRYVRLADGDLGLAPANDSYWIRLQYTVSTDVFAFIAETTAGAKTADSADVKHLDLCEATRAGGNWTSVDIDLRASNTALAPPVVLSGDTDASVAPVLLVEQLGVVETSIEAIGGDVVFFTSGNPFELRVFGDGANAIGIHNVANSVQLVCGAASRLDVLGLLNVTTTGSVIASTATVGGVAINAGSMTGATDIATLATITLNNAGATLQLTNGADQTVAFSNLGGGNIDVDVDGDITSGTGIIVTAGGIDVTGNSQIVGILSNVTAIDTLDTIVLNNAGAQVELTAGADQTFTFTNLGAGNLDLDVDGDVTSGTGMTVTTGGLNIVAGGATIAGTVDVTGDIIADSLALEDSVNQIVLDSDAGNTGTITMAALAAGRTWTLPDNDGTFVVGENSNALTITDGIITIADPLTVGDGGTGQTGWTQDQVLYASAAATLDQISDAGWNNSAYYLTGGTPPNWVNALIPATVTATGQVTGTPVTSTTYVSAGSYVNATTYLQGDYVRLEDDAVASSNRITLGNVAGSGNAFEVVDEAGEWFRVDPSTVTCYLTSSGTAMGIGENTYFGGDMTVGNSKDIFPENSNNADCGRSTNYWDNVYAGTFWYKFDSTLQSFDHLDDIAIIESIGAKKGRKNKRTGAPYVDLSGLPEEIVTEEGFVVAGNMSMLLVGAIKQMSAKVNEQNEMIGMLMDQIEEMKANAS